MQVGMAKSEIPSIVVHPGAGCLNNGGSASESAMGERPRLAKQEEVDTEEESLAPSPITIHIQGERDGVGDRPEEEDSMDSGDPVVRPPLSSVESMGGSSDSDSRTAERTVSRSHTHGKAGNKKQLCKQGSSQRSQDGSSPSLSRDSSTETYTDSTGIDLQQFIVDTLHKSQKDRAMLLKIEQDLYTLVKDNKCQVFKFTPMSSYNRMLVHRVAAFFGMEHNIDKPGTSVIVNKTKNTRLPDVRFSEYIRDELLPEEPKKLILKRDSASFEEGKESPERQSSLDNRRSKSFEEREEEYEKARARIFNQDEGYGDSPYSLHSQDGTLNSSRRSSQEDLRTWTRDPRPWSSTDSDSSSRKANSFELESGPVAGNKNAETVTSSSSSESTTKASAGNSTGLLHPNQVLVSGGGTASIEGRPSLVKASSFGGITLLTRDNPPSGGTDGGKGPLLHPPRLTKAESLNETISSGRSHLQVQQTNPCEGLARQSLQSQEVKGQSGQASPLLPAQHDLSSPGEILPVVYALEPSTHHTLIDKNASQACHWEVPGVLKEGSVIASSAAGESQAPAPGVSVSPGAAIWPVASVDSIPPGSLLLNPAVAAGPYFSPPEAVGYQAKALSPTQAYVVTPIHALKGPLLPPPPTATMNGQLVTNLGSQSQTNPQPQLGSVPGSQYGAFVYIPCVASHMAQGALQPQPQQQQQSATSAPSTTTLQFIQARQQQQPQQPQPHMGEQRANQTVMPDLVSQLSVLTLSPPPPPPQPQSASGACEMTSYLVPTPSGDFVAKLQLPTPAAASSSTTSSSSASSSLKPQTAAALPTQVPLYYVPQNPTGLYNNVRYICPGGGPMILHAQQQQLPSNTLGPSHPATTPACCIKNVEGLTSPDNSLAQSPPTHLVGQPQTVYPSYTFLGFPPQNVEPTSVHHIPTSATVTVPYGFQATTPAAVVNNGPTLATTTLPTVSTSVPMYQYNSGTGGSNIIFNGAIPNSSQQQSQQVYGQQTPICVMGSNALTFSTQAQNRVSAAANVLQGVAPSVTPSNPSPYLSYAVYSPHSNNISSLPSSFLHVLRPSLATASTNQHTASVHHASGFQQPRMQSVHGVPVQFATASGLPKPSLTPVPQPQLQRGKVLLPTKQDMILKEALNSAGAELKLSGGVPRFQLSNASNPSVCIPQTAPLYRQSHPFFPDVRLLGRPVHPAPQVNPALLLAHHHHHHHQQQQQQQQQHHGCLSTPAYPSHHQSMHQQQQYSVGPGVQVVRGMFNTIPGRGGPGGGGSSRKARNKAPTYKGNSSSSLSSSSVEGSHPSGTLAGTGNPLVLEVDGTPQGFRPSELERYLEPLVVNYGAKIQVQSCSGGPAEAASPLQGGDCLLNTPCKHQVLAIFESEAAAQSALLNIKTHKFQLRPPAPCKHSKS